MRQTFGLRKVLHYKTWQDFMLKQQPGLVGVNLVCLWNLTSVLVSNEQFVSCYGSMHETKSLHSLWKCIHKFKHILLRIGLL